MTARRLLIKYSDHPAEHMRFHYDEAQDTIYFQLAEPPTPHWHRERINSDVSLQIGAEGEVYAVEVRKAARFMNDGKLELENLPISVEQLQRKFTRQKPDLEALKPELKALCERWHVVELSVFGSVLGDGFGPLSDVDVCVQYDDANPPQTFDEVSGFKRDLESLFGAPVDIVELDKVRNEVRKKSILESKRVIFSAD